MSTPPRSTLTRSLAALGALVGAAACGFAGLNAVSMPSSSAATCSNVEVLFARGTGEAQGLGSVGPTFVNNVASALPGQSVTSYAVVYAAATNQSSGGAGSTDLVNHLTATASACPGTKFVLGGYSQGATVVDKALGISTSTGGTGTAIPAALSGRVAAAVAFGNPLGLQGQTIASASPTYGARSKDYCNTGDPVCGGGSNFAAHTQYVSNGSAAAGGKFAAGLVGAATPTSPAPTTPAPTTPAPTTPAPTTPAPTTPAPTTPAPTTPAPTGTCVTASTRSHVDAGRATSVFGRAYAIGTRDSLGAVSPFNTVTLKQNSATSWSKVTRC